MTAIEIIALTLVGFSVIKLVVLAIKPGAWYGSGNPLVKMWSNTASAIVLPIALGAIVLRHLLVELTMVQIFAATAFAFLFLMISLAPYTKRIIGMVQEDIAADDHFLRKHWLSTLLWMVLLVWVIWEIFI